MLIVDINTLQTINTLNLLYKVILYSGLAFYSHNVMRVKRTFCDWIAGLDFLTFANLYSGTKRYQIRKGFTSLLISHNNLTLLFSFAKMNSSCSLCNDSDTLRLSSLKKLLDTRKTLCNIIALSNTAGVERSHCQLCTRLTDRLGGNYTNCFAYINRLRSSKVHTVTLRTNTNLTAAFNHRTYLNFFYS